MPADVDRIRSLNDALRTQGDGGAVVVSPGIAALSAPALADLLLAIASFDAFTPDNDPYGEHDCAVVCPGSAKVIWKIDYYDPSLSHHSDDPAEPAVTRRVMTVMLAEEC